MFSGICSGYLVKPRILVNEEVDRSSLCVSQKTLSFLRDVLRVVVSEGTARQLRYFKNFSIYAKTGTAQVVGLQKQVKGAKQQLEHAWFVSYFSYRNQKPLAMVILLENVGSSSYATALAGQFFRLYQASLTQKDSE